MRVASMDVINTAVPADDSKNRNFRIVEKQIILNLSELLRRQGLLSNEEKMRMRDIINSQ